MDTRANIFTKVASSYYSDTQNPRFKDYVLTVVLASLVMT